MFYYTSGPHGLPHDPFKSLVAPRPIGWISSISAQGKANLAPFSFFNAVASDPPVVIFGANGAHWEGGYKDTLANIKETGEFVVNIAIWELREQMNLTSGDWPRGVDELKAVGLTPAPSRMVTAPRVAEAPANLECKLLQLIDLPTNNPQAPNVAILGHVVCVHISESIITDGLIDMNKFRPIARLGYMDYAVVDNVFTMLRPKKESLTPREAAPHKG